APIGAAPPRSAGEDAIPDRGIADLFEADQLPVPVEGEDVGGLVALTLHAGGRQHHDLVAVGDEVVRFGFQPFRGEFGPEPADLHRPAIHLSSPVPSTLTGSPPASKGRTGQTRRIATVRSVWRAGSGALGCECEPVRVSRGKP